MIFLLSSILLTAKLIQTGCADPIQVQILVRHGARTPLTKSYPTDPYLNYDYTPYVLGQLTLEGKRDAFEIGQQLRDRYSHFIKNAYFREGLLNVTADDDSRVKETALTLAASFWPPLENETIIPGLNWQPVLYSYYQQTPISEKLNESIFETDEFLLSIRPFQDDINYIMNHSGVATMEKFEYVYSSLLAQDHLGLPLPEWSLQVYPAPIQQINGLYLAASGMNQEWRMYSCQSILDMINIFKATVENKILKNAPLNIYSSHDTNIAVAMQCLNLDAKQYQALYVGNLALELYDKPYFGVKVMWQEGKKEQPKYLNVIGCDNELCPFDTFVKIVETRAS